MRDLSNDVVVQINEKGISYLQFKVLLNLGVQHAFILKSDRAPLKYRGRVSTKEEEIAAYSSVCDCLGWDLLVRSRSNGYEIHIDPTRK